MVVVALLGNRRVIASWSPLGSDFFAERRQVSAHSGFRARVALGPDRLVESSDVVVSSSPLHVQKWQIGSEFTSTITACFRKGFSRSVLHRGLFMDPKHAGNRSTTPP